MPTVKCSTVLLTFCDSDDSVQMRLKQRGGGGCTIWQPNLENWIQRNCVPDVSLDVESEVFCNNYNHGDSDIHFNRDYMHGISLNMQLFHSNSVLGRRKTFSYGLLIPMLSKDARIPKQLHKKLVKLAKKDPMKLLTYLKTQSRGVSE